MKLYCTFARARATVVNDATSPASASGSNVMIVQRPSSSTVCRDFACMYYTVTTSETEYGLRSADNKSAAKDEQEEHSFKGVDLSSGA